MLKKQDFVAINALAQHDVYIKDIAAELGVHPQTPSRTRQHGSARAFTHPIHCNKHDPFKPKMDQLLVNVGWNSVVSRCALQPAGYTGSPYVAWRPPRSGGCAAGGPLSSLRPRPTRNSKSDQGEIVTTFAHPPANVRFIVNELPRSTQASSVGKAITLRGLSRKRPYSSTTRIIRWGRKGPGGASASQAALTGCGQ